MQKVIRFVMCGINKPYLPWFSHYFTFKFWWRHNDVTRRSQKFVIHPMTQFRSSSWKPVVGLSPISFTFLKLSVAKLVINYHAVPASSSRIPLHFHLPIYQLQNRKGCKADPLLKSQGSRHSRLYNSCSFSTFRWTTVPMDFVIGLLDWLQW